MVYHVLNCSPVWGNDGLWLWWVGGWPTPLKNMSSSVGMMTFPIYGKIKNVPNHQPVIIFRCIYSRIFMQVLGFWGQRIWFPAEATGFPYRIFVYWRDLQQLSVSTISSTLVRWYSILLHHFTTHGSSWPATSNCAIPGEKRLWITSGNVLKPIIYK